MNKYIKIIIAVLIICLIAAIPLLGNNDLPERIVVPSGSKAVEKAEEEPVEIAEEESYDETPIVDETAEDLTEDWTYEEAPPQTDTTELPAENEPINLENADPSCSLTVSCHSVLNNMDKLKDKKKGVVPDNGIILLEEHIEFTDGESVFDILCRMLEAKNIQFDYVSNPFTDSVYVKGIGNLYEFDCGSMSGWLYKVNGEKASYGCSEYIVKDNDKIEFYYTCNYMNDM